MLWTLSPAARMPSASTIQVAIVDDDLALGRQMADCLNRYEIRAVHNDSAQAAIDTVRRRKPRVVLVDVDMPGMDGIEAAKIILDEAPSTRILLMSGYLDQVRRANEAGIDVYAVLDKPVPLQMLARFVTNALGRNEGARSA